MNENQGLFEKLLQRQAEIDQEIFKLRAKIIDLTQESTNIKTTTKIVGDLIGVSVIGLTSPTNVCEIVSKILYEIYPKGMTSGEILAYKSAIRLNRFTRQNRRRIWSVICRSV